MSEVSRKWNGRMRSIRARTQERRHISRRSLGVSRFGSVLVTPRHLPVVRAACESGPRPCPYVSCRHHLYLDVNLNGSIKWNFPDLEPWELEESCSLDVASRGVTTLWEVARYMNLTRNRIMQLLDRVVPVVRPVLQRLQEGEE